MLQELDYKEMNQITGGVSVAEYCATLDMLIENNWSSWDSGQKESAANAYSKHC